MKQERKRLFLAILLPHLIRSQLADYQEKTDIVGIRWIPPENLHITVHFIGSTQTELVSDISQAVREKVAGLLPFKLTFEKICYMPNRHPRMIWAQFYENDDYTNLTKNLQKVLNQYVPVSEKEKNKKAIPHITIARIPKNIYKLPRDLPLTTLPDLSINSVVLMESELNKNGSNYFILDTFPCKL
jgi:2'-5' RNA ligase